SGRIAAGALTVASGLPLAGAWIAVGLLVGWTCFRSRHLLRLGHASTRIDLAVPGSAVVRGRVVPMKIVEAPVSHRACVAYEVRRANDRPAKVERACEDFLVDDGTGRARVLAADAQLVLDPIERVSRAVESRIVARSATGAGPGAGVVSAVGTAIERVILPGDEVIVCGRAICQVGASPHRIQVAFHGGSEG